MTPLLNKVASLIGPLTEFYDSVDAITPHLDAVEPDMMPQPYRRLLVHNHDMTPTLEAFSGQPIHLKLLARLVDDGVLYREVVLLAGPDEQPMEFGAIKIHLDRFDAAPRKLILEGRRPLGTILNDYEIAHASSPTGYFSIDGDVIGRRAFNFDDDTDATRLFGRHNVLRDAAGCELAEVVEILPPLEDAHGQ